VEPREVPRAGGERATRVQPQKWVERSQVITALEIGAIDSKGANRVKWGGCKMRNEDVVARKEMVSFVGRKVVRDAVLGARDSHAGCACGGSAVWSHHD
jgi:hypothetical protein